MRLLAAGLITAAIFLPACSSCGDSLEAPQLKDAHVDDRIMLDGGVAGTDAEPSDPGVFADAAPADSSGHDDATSPDAEPADSGEIDSGEPDAGQEDTGVDPCPRRAIFSEDFEGYAQGEMLAAVWTSSVVGTGEARINLDVEGEGAAQSLRYMIMHENESESNVWVATPEIDLRACTNRIVTIDARLIPFSLMAASDVLRIEAADDGMSFIELGTLFPGTAFADNTCAPGSQQACVPWGSFSYSIPSSAFGARFRVGLRLIGDGRGAVGIDDFSINVR